MPVLERPRHENYCQLIVSGMSQIDAYEKAGFERSAQNASKFNAYPHIQMRIKEIQESRIAIINEPYSKPTVTRDYVLGTLVENIERSMQHKQAVDSDGNPVGEFRWEGTIANKSLELLGKELGMFVERRVSLTGSIDSLDHDRARALRQMLTKQVEPAVVEIEGLEAQAIEIIKPDKPGE